MYWEKDIETLSREELHELQLKKLGDTIQSASRSPYYSKLFADKRITEDSIRDIKDIHKIPFTTKEDLREHFPYGFLSVSKRDVIRLHSSSGTTGNPTAIFHTKHDLNSWANLVARSLYSTGARDSDVFQNICGYGLFTGGLGFQYGGEALGALTIPAGAGNSKRQIKLMQDYGTTVIHAIPSYLIYLHDVFNDMGLNPKTDLQLRILVIGAEPHTESHRKRIENLFGVKAFNSYGLSEMNGPGVAFECTEQNGLHIWEDAFLVEIIDPETLESLPEGETGELVLTTLDRQAMPLLRYRTRDLTRIIPGECKCGRTHRRIERLKGRSDDMFIIKGCNVFPMQIEKVLMDMPEVANNYLITLQTVDDIDEMVVEVEVQKEWFGDDEFASLEKVRNKITQAIKNEVLAKPIVKLVQPGKIEKGEGKAIRVIDNRNNIL